MNNNIFLHILIVYISKYGVKSLPIHNEIVSVYQENNNHMNNEIISHKNKVTVDDNNMYIGTQANIPRLRVKRQNSGAGRFAEASKMPQLKLLRLFLQMFKNFWDSSYVGGSHPLHRDVPKTIVALYKEKVVEFFIPDVGQEKAMQ